MCHGKKTAVTQLYSHVANQQQRWLVAVYFYSERESLENIVDPFRVELICHISEGWEHSYECVGGETLDPPWLSLYADSLSPVPHAHLTRRMRVAFLAGVTIPMLCGCFLQSCSWKVRPICCRSLKWGF